MRYAFLDLETTGFDPKKDSIIEASIVVEEDGHEVGRVDRVVVPDKSGLSDFVSQLTGISQAEIDQNGVGFSSLKEEITQLLQDTVIVGHNIDFDINFLIGNGVDLSQHERLDTHELARILLPGESSYALEVLTKNYGFTHKDAHRAMSDVLASKDLFYFLHQKIESLPCDFLDQIKVFLHEQTAWYARHLFLAAVGQAQSQTRTDTAGSSVNLLPNDTTRFLSGEVADGHNLFMRVGDMRQATNTLSVVAQTLAEQGKKVCIVTPKLDYFSAFASLPTPGVLFDETRSADFLAARNHQLNDAETTFYLKCLYRHYLGYRGLWDFDLFFKERDLWNEVNAQSLEAGIFQTVAAEKAALSILTCSPGAWAELYQQSVLSDRVVLVDEGELSAEMWLKAPTKSFNFNGLLHHPDEQVASATQFFIGRFVRDFMEPVLGKTFGTFPERLLLNFKDQLGRFKEELASLLPAAEQDFWLDWLEPVDEKLTRWVVYAPESGNLSFYAWHPDAWRALKKSLHERPKLVTIRHDIEANDRLFLRVFLGEIEGENVDLRTRETRPELVVPTNLVSQASPEFNGFCADKIKQVFASAPGNVVANFSGLEALRNTFDAVQPSMGEAQFLAAEKVMGGDGKLLEKLVEHQDEKILFLFQKILTPALEAYEWSDLVIQKFPFGAPDPLLQHLEEKMKQGGHNWWNAWVMPRLSSTLSRKIGQFPNLKTVHFLDPRENSRWGKSVLDDVF